PVPTGKGARSAAARPDFNGDGLRDLVLDELVRESSHADDAGIGIVYGSVSGVLDPRTRQLLTPARNAAPTDGVVPAAFESEAVCDLDGDGYSDLVVTTDPPYDGIGQPPVPLQLLFGGPKGLTAKAVKLRIPARSRAGNEWPDQPVCGDFDGDGAADLTVTASAGQLSFLRGPFTRGGAPRAAAAPIPANATVLAAPEPREDADGDGYDDLAVRAAAGKPARLLLGGPAGPGRAGGAYT
ncbi:VCBS repeat-containing protein, partial [Streptomyces sp. GC420]|uniref:FG-GAP repeat domain-containing protein n=1 Tax=Streptomyces sp. GC420 TaxID=2697568 RepID=UPI001414F8D4